MDLKELLRTHFRIEILAEEVKRRLAQNPIFTLKSAFEILDYRGKGQVTLDDMRHLIQDRGFFISDNDAKQLFSKFSRDQRYPSIGQAEFISEMTPKLK